jgi:hypothetical protein
MKTPKVKVPKAPKTPKVRSPFAVSVKQLGEFNTPDFCPRCFILKNQMRGKGHEIPFMFPAAGVLSRLDSMQKHLVKDSATLPSFLSAYATQECLELHRMTETDPTTGIELTGVPDLAFRDADRNISIIDLKSSKPATEVTEWSEKMLGIYTSQLHGYKHLLEARGEGTITSLSIIYLWPETIVEADGGVTVQFKASTLVVPIDDTLIPRLMAKAKALLDQKELPAVSASCPDCERVANFIKVAGAVIDEEVLEEVEA